MRVHVVCWCYLAFAAARTPAASGLCCHRVLYFFLTYFQIVFVVDLLGQCELLDHINSNTIYFFIFQLTWQFFTSFVKHGLSRLA